MKTPFAGVICLAQTQACGQSLGSPWPGGQGEVWRGMERPKAAPSWSCSLLPSLLGVVGFSTWGSTGQSLCIQLYCCTCLLVARILAPKISPNRNHLEQTPALKPRSLAGCSSSGVESPAQSGDTRHNSSPFPSSHAPCTALLPFNPARIPLATTFLQSPGHAGALLDVPSPAFPAPWHGVQLVGTARSFRALHCFPVPGGAWEVP